MRSIVPSHSVLRFFGESLGVKFSREYVTVLSYLFAGVAGHRAVATDPHHFACRYRGRLQRTVSNKSCISVSLASISTLTLTLDYDHDHDQVTTPVNDERFRKPCIVVRDVALLAITWFCGIFYLSSFSSYLLREHRDSFKWTLSIPVTRTIHVYICRHFFTVHIIYRQNWKLSNYT